jgi:protein-S-isoprenylcysteine O-methyltransferase Ste14
MTVTVAKAIFVLGLVAWSLIRYPYERRSRRVPVRTSKQDRREKVLLAIAVTCLGIVPVVYVFSNSLSVADYPFHPALAWIGTLAFLSSLWLFYQSHRDLGRNFSNSLNIRDDHILVATGIYTYVRHPMYSAFWLWAAAQGLLLPNWVAGPAGFVGFGILFFLRIEREEQLMLDEFKEQYRSYVSRTARIVPWIY